MQGVTKPMILYICSENVGGVFRGLLPPNL